MMAAMWAAALFLGIAHAGEIAAHDRPIGIADAIGDAVTGYDEGGGSAEAHATRGFAFLADNRYTEATAAFDQSTPWVVR